MIRERELTKSEWRIIHQIAERAISYFGGKIIDWELDLIAVHKKCPLRLYDLLMADGTNFIHDLSGIHRHLDRDTGLLLDCFTPRYAVQ